MNIKSLFSWLDPRKFITVRYQVVIILFSAVFFLYLFHQQAVLFTNTDPHPEIKILTPDSVRKFLGSSVGHKVETGMHIENFQEFDLRKGNFTIDAIVWFRFNPSVISLETISQFSFEKGQIEKKSKPKTKLINGVMLARFDVRLKFTTNLNYRLFPFNDHKIFITLTNKKVTPGELIFESYESDLSLSENMLISGWENVGHSVETGYTEALLDRHDPTTKVFQPVAIFSVDFNQTGTREAFILLLPLFVVLYLSFISLLVVFEYGTRISLATGNIAALLGYRFVIENAAPKVGYSMVTDLIFNLFLALTFIVFLINIFFGKKEERRWRGIILIILHTTVLISIYYLVKVWMKT